MDAQGRRAMGYFHYIFKACLRTVFLFFYTIAQASPLVDMNSSGVFLS